VTDELTNVERKVYSIDFVCDIPVYGNLREIILDADLINHRAELTLRFVLAGGLSVDEMRKRISELAEVLALDGFLPCHQGADKGSWAAHFVAEDAFDTGERNILRLCARLSTFVNGPVSKVDNCEILEEIAEVKPGEGRELEWISRGELFAEKLRKQLS